MNDKCMLNEWSMNDQWMINDKCMINEWTMYDQWMINEWSMNNQWMIILYRSMNDQWMIIKCIKCMTNKLLNWWPMTVECKFK